MGINLEKNNFINNTNYLSKDRLNKKNYNAHKPLNNNVNFRGLFNPKVLQRVTNTLMPSKFSEISPVLEKRAIKLLESRSDHLADLYNGFKRTFLDRAKVSEGFRKTFGIDDKALELIKNGSAITIPEKNIFRKFVSDIFSPLRIFGDIYSWAINSKLAKWGAKHNKTISNLVQKNAEKINDAKIVRNYRSYTGLLDSIKIWEAKQRNIAGISAWDGQKGLLTSPEVFESKVLRRWLKSVDPTKGKYDARHLQVGNRLISGTVYTILLGNDAYNTTMRYSNSETEAKSQRRARMAQEIAKIGINMYLLNSFLRTFDKYINKSIFHSLFVASATTMTTEILGRKLVGRPIFPSDKETLDKMSKEMEEKKGFWVSLGRLISGTKPKQKTQKSAKAKKLMVLSEEKGLSFKGKNQDNITDKQVSFKGIINKNKKSDVSFGSFAKVTNLMNSKNVKDMLALIEQADSKIYGSFVEIINKSLKNMPGDKNLQTILETEKLIPIGSKKTLKYNLLRSLASPYYFLKNMGKGIISGVKKLFTKSNTTSTVDEMAEKLNKLIKENPAIEQEYNKFSQKMNLSKLWQASSYDDKTKQAKILSEFLESFEKDTEEIEGIKNILTYLNKQLKSKELTPKNIETTRNILYENFKKTDGTSHLEYDGNTVSMLNVNLSRAITTLFLVVDAYNLSMQYSNNDKNIAINNGKSRALQEASRITVSAYMLAFVHNLLSKFCNSNLFGAFTTTALTSSMNDTIARKVVGVPIGTKTYEELIEIDKQNAKSKSPLKRTLAYLIGKRQKNKPVQNTSKTDYTPEFSLSITKSFKSILDSK